MRLNSISVEEHGSGYALTMRFHVGSEEVVGDQIDSFLKVLMGESFAAIALGSADELGSRDTNEDPSASYDNDQAEAAPDPTPAPAAEPVSRRRRRSTAATEETPADDGKDTPEEEKPRGRRGRRGKAAADPTSEASESSSDEAPPSGRRGRRGSKTETTSSDTAITDEDLTKAVSDAARITSAIAVMEIVEEFDAAKVNEIPDDKRQDFLDRLAKMSEEK